MFITLWVADMVTHLKKKHRGGQVRTLGPRYGDARGPGPSDSAGGEDATGRPRRATLAATPKKTPGKKGKQTRAKSASHIATDSSTCTKTDPTDMPLCWGTLESLGALLTSQGISIEEGELEPTEEEVGLARCTWWTC